MRILRVISSVDPKAGGPIEGLKLSSSIMTTLGHETEVVSLDYPDASHVAEFTLPVHAVGKWVRKYGYTPALANWISANGHRFDAAVVHGLWNHASVGGWQGLRRAGLP
ncbi:MAG: transferase, partial [Sphingobacteriales bacterium]